MFDTEDSYFVQAVKEINDRWVRVGGIGLLWLRDLYSSGLFTSHFLSSNNLKLALESLIVITLSWEIPRWIIIRFQRRYPHLSQTRTRILLLLPLCWLTIFLIFLVDTFFDFWAGNQGSKLLGTQVFTANVNMGALVAVGALMASGALVFSGFTIGMQEAVYYFNRLLKSERETEALKKENLQTQLDSLKQQVNPHFLFNSLNTLSYLIGDDTERAEEFLNELCKVYRYLLRANEHELTDLATELQFIRSYFHLLKTRYGNSLHLNIAVSTSFDTYLLPSLTLQLLLENAVKHNVIDKNQPLRVDISTGPDALMTVKNNLQRKPHQMPSTRVGLHNIATKFRLLGQGDVQVQETADQFIVSFPLITSGSIAARL
ncbi:sensor histidine kinase [Fibrella aquatilis]|uniref:Histidine kinase n=1 Tax=Fibrella aquatilis TaxID=2817059 RepID=A0A939GA00_9BACT|nr:sensor histidine kinase [Fibrella aquatilis]MBO0932523.1 histidine kinase [Fibrella aquatilis]